MHDAVITARGLTVYQGSRPTVRALDLAIQRGCVYGFLGRNGAGKTTVIRMLLGLLRPTRGSGTILGSPITAIPPSLRERIGYISEHHPVYGWMRVRGWAEFQKGFYPRWKDTIFAAILDHFRITLDARIATLSRGQQAGLCLATTLAPQPELLILDDPTLGLDPIARGAFLEAMIFLTRGGERTVLFSSHQLSDIERVADRVGILEEGRLMADCSMDTFRERIRRVTLTPSDPSAPASVFPGMLTVRRLDRQWEVTYVTLPGSDEALARLGQGLQAQTLQLEEAFTAYVGERGMGPSLLQRMGAV